MTTQNAKLLVWLESHDGATTAEVTANLKIYRLSERIRELEALGYRISHTPETTNTGARVIRYRLLKAGESKVTHYKGMAIVEQPPMSQSAPILNSDPDSVTKWKGTPIIDAAPSATDAHNPARRPAMMAEHVMANGKILRYMFE